MRIYISGIHTDAGKTHFSAAFCANLNYDYFKLIQAGEETDSELVAKLSPQTRIFKEGIKLKTSASPHLAKLKEGLDYQGLDIALPQSQNLLIELAGGLFTPMDEKNVMIDYMSEKLLPTILVARYYLGSINHIILSIEALRTRKIPLLGVAMMGEKQPLQDEFIKNYAKVRIINLNFFDEKSIINEDFARQAKELLKLFE